jgi:hypothetical protein
MKNYYLLVLCFPFLYGCLGWIHENDGLEQTQHHEQSASDNILLPEKQNSIEEIIKSFGFNTNYTRNKCANWTFLEVSNVNMKFETSANFIKKIGIINLKSAFDIDASFRPGSFMWRNDEILIFEFELICPIDFEEMKKDDYSVYRTVVLNTLSNQFHFFDLYKTNEKSRERISIQKSDNIVFYDIERMYDSNKQVEIYHYSKYEYNLLSNKQTFILRDTTDTYMIGDINIDEYLCEKEGVKSLNLP